MSDVRPDPDALLAAAAREGRGRLKVFLGAAPGVGKTWEMLAQARRRQTEGTDVLAGIIETHGRAETEAQAAGLPLLPRREVAYRGQTLHEFDGDAALARRPGLLLVDELAHTNAPGSRHNKRWEDVQELVDAGLHVWATLNVQHLESLNDDVARITGVRVMETLPDGVLDGADEIELIDVPPAELRARLADGRIYRTDTARRALDGYFKEGNLAALREIALRRAAAHVDDDVRDWMRASGVAGPWPAGDRVLALVGSDASGKAVVRHAKRLADALHAPWMVLHVEQPAANLASRPSLALARQLGAEVETRSGADVAGTALAVAQACNATHIVMGRARLPWWRRLLGRSLGLALLRRAPAYALHIVPSPAVARPRRPVPHAPQDWRGWAAATALVAGVTVAGLMGEGAVPAEALGMVFLAVVAASASLQGLPLALYAAVAGFLAWDFFFIPPVHEVTIANAHDAVAAAVFLVVAVITGVLAGRVRAEARAGQARIDSLRRVGAFSRRLGEPATEPDLLHEVARQAAAIAGQAAVLLRDGEDVLLRAAEPHVDTLDEGAWAAARWAAAHGTEAGRGTSTLPAASWRFLPMRTVRGGSGVLGVRAPAAQPGGAGDAFDPPTLQALEALADQAAIALERVRLAGQSARTVAMEETQRLRTALLNSLSHDLRTPLTGIRGAAETLRGSWDGLAPGTRADLLLSIEQDTARMTRFLSNILDLTRLESGQVLPRLAALEVDAVIEAAVARVPGALHVGLALPDPPPRVLADAALLEQVLVNLLENAVKYAPGGAQAAVRVAMARSPGGRADVSLTVADEGVGIPAADLPHVFDSFYRARRGDQVAPGTGLGLAIARGLVEAMDGSIEATSPRPDLPRDGLPGTAVTLRLPAAP